jgi:hypothetical protein
MRLSSLYSHPILSPIPITIHFHWSKYRHPFHVFLPFVRKSIYSFALPFLSFLQSPNTQNSVRDSKYTEKYMEISTSTVSMRGGTHFDSERGLLNSADVSGIEDGMLVGESGDDGEEADVYEDDDRDYSL